MHQDLVNLADPHVDGATSRTLSLERDEFPESADVEAGFSRHLHSDFDESDHDDNADSQPHAHFSHHEIAGAIAEILAKPRPRRPMSQDRSRLAVTLTISILAHAGIGVVCFMLAATFLVVNPGQTDPRLGAATSEGGYTDVTPNSDPANIPSNENRPPTPPPADRSSDLENNAGVTPSESFANGATDQSVAEPIDPDAAQPLFGPQSIALSAPVFPKRKPAVAAANDAAPEAMTAAASQVAAAPAPPSAGPPAAAPAHHPVIGAARPKGSPGGHRNGFDLDERGIPIPEYPLESHRRREEGLVQLDLEILPNGTIGRIAIVNDAGYPRLAAAAVASARAARFEPQTYDGQSVACHLIVPYRFELR